MGGFAALAPRATFAPTRRATGFLVRSPSVVRKSAGRAIVAGPEQRANHAVKATNGLPDFGHRSMATSATNNYKSITYS